MTSYIGGMKSFDLNSVYTSNVISWFLHRADYIKFKILDVYLGERFDDTCISEINVY